ncbi:MAG: AEC family transporter, partial [Candidatus Marinimicrobia bacterium]|nr:AEC family transporter [Candidatus Neomarinimicrobiota bacterium]
GLIFSYFNFQIELLNKGLSLVGKTAGGLAIFSLGIFMYDNFSVQAAKKAFKYSLLRMIVLPVITYIVLLIYTDIDTGMRMFLFLQSGIPAAISLSVFADRYNYKLEEITGIVIITSAFSFVGLLLLFFISNYSF